MARIEVVAHFPNLGFRPVEPGAAPAMIDAPAQFRKAAGEPALLAVQHGAVAAGDAGVAGHAVRLMYTFRIERVGAAMPQRQA